MNHTGKGAHATPFNNALRMPPRADAHGVSHNRCAGYAFGGGGSGAARSEGGVVVAIGATRSDEFRTPATFSMVPLENTTLHVANALQQLGCTGTSQGGCWVVTSADAEPLRTDAGASSEPGGVVTALCICADAVVGITCSVAPPLSVRACFAHAKSTPRRFRCSVRSVSKEPVMRRRRMTENLIRRRWGKPLFSGVSIPPISAASLFFWRRLYTVVARQLPLKRCHAGGVVRRCFVGRDCVSDHGAIETDVSAARFSGAWLVYAGHALLCAHIGNQRPNSGSGVMVLHSPAGGWWRHE